MHPCSSSPSSFSSPPFPGNARQELFLLLTTFRQSLEASPGHSSICHPKAEAQGSHPVLLSGPCMAAAGRAESCWQAEGSLAPWWDLLVTVQQEDRALQGMDTGLHSQEPQQGWGPAPFTQGGTVAAAQ